MGVADEGVRLTLRLPEELRDSLLKTSNGNHRSMNGEIVAKLESAQPQRSEEADTLTETLLDNCRQLSNDSISLLVELSRRLRS